MTLPTFSKCPTMTSELPGLWSPRLKAVSALACKSSHTHYCSLCAETKHTSSIALHYSASWRRVKQCLSATVRTHQPTCQSCRSLDAYHVVTNIPLPYHKLVQASKTVQVVPIQTDRSAEPSSGGETNERWAVQLSGGMAWVQGVCIL